MKKIFIVVTLIILIGAGWYIWSHRDTATIQSQQDIQANSQSLSDPMVTPLPPEEQSGVINSIKDAMGLGKKMACTYTDTAHTGISTTVFVDGQKVKTASVINGETMYGLFDGETQYTWTTDATQQGFKMNQSCMDEIKNLAQKTPTENTPVPTPIQDLQSFDNAQNVSCVAMGDEDFSIPSDIDFIDQCEMLRSSMKALKQMKQGLPKDVSIPVRY